MKAQEKIYPLLNLSFFGDDGTGNFVSGPATTNGLIAVVDGVVTTGSVPISLTFVTNAEAMRINPVGNVGFGTTTPVEIVDISGNIQLKSIGNKIKIKEGSNASMGIATLVAGTVTVPNTIVTANSRIMLTAQSLGNYNCSSRFSRISKNAIGFIYYFI